MNEQWIGVIKDLKINWQLLMSTRRRKIRVKSVTYEFQDGSVVVFKKKNFICIQKDLKKQTVPGFNIRLMGC